MKNVYALILLFCLSISTYSQTWLYTQQVSPRINASLRGLTLDLDTNLYFTAFYRSSQSPTLGYTDYIGIPGVVRSFPGPYHVAAPSDTKQDILIVKVAQTGDTLWTKSIGGTDSDYPVNLEVNYNNDPYVAGFFKSASLSIQGTSLANFASGSNDVFLAKYTADGANSFARRVIWGAGDQQVSQIAIDGAGNIYMVGSYVGTAVFQSVTLTASPAGDTSMFIAKFKANGDLRWAKDINTGGADYNKTNFVEISIANDQEIYMGGFFKGTVSKDGIGVTSQGTGEDMLIMKVDSSGSLQWMRMGGANNVADRCNGITTSSNGDVYITGYFQGTAKFDSTGRGLLNSSSLVSAGSYDMFMAKYNSSGRLQWKHRNGSTGADIAYSAKIRENILQFTGYFTGTVNFNNTTIASNPINIPDAGFFVYDIDGNPITAKSIQGTLEDRGEYIEYGLKGNTYIGGYFKSPSLTVGSLPALNKQASRAATSSDAFVAKFHNPFSATFSTHDNIDCPNNNTGKLIATTYFGTAPYAYNWGASTGHGTYTDSAATNLTAGFYSVTITDARDSVVTVNYTLTDSPDFSITLDSTNLTCYQSANGAITTTASGGNGGLTYSWSGPGVTAPTNQNQAGLSAGMYHITITDTKGCNAYDSIRVIEPQPLYFGKVAIMPEDPKDSRAGSIELNVSGGTTPYQYTWDFNSVAMAGRTHDTLTHLQEGLYTAHISDKNLCLADTNIVVPGDSLRIQMFADNVKCYNEANGKAWTKITSGDKGFTYLYTFTDNNSNTLTPVNDTLYNLTPGWYFVTIQEQGGDNRTASNKINITQPDSIDLTLTPDVLLCYGNTNGNINLAVTGGTPAYDYNWTNGDNTQNSSNNGAGWKKVTVTDANSCVAVDSAEIIQPDKLVISAIDTANLVCFGVNNGHIGVTLLGGILPYSYTWNPVASDTNYIDQLAAGNYVVYTFDNNGCAGDTFAFTVKSPTPVVFQDIQLVNPTCFGNTNGSITITAAGGTGASYQYSADGGTSYSSNETFTGLSPDNFTLKLIDGNDCESADSIVSIENPQDITIVSETSSNALCYGLPGGTISITVSGIASDFDYSIDNGTSFISNSGEFESLLAGTYQVVVRNQDNCEKPGSQLIISQPDELIVDTLSVEPAVDNTNGAIVVLAQGGTSPFNYVLNDGGSDSVTNASGDFQELQPGLYIIYALDDKSCKSDTIQVRVFSLTTELKIYDAFSPNGDGVNDAWNIENISKYPNCKVIIFNSWGNHVFSSNGYSEPWNGSYKGKELPAGTYYYIIDLGDGSDELSGPVSIVR
jgi:gliding motility-associated-like protein